MTDCVTCHQPARTTTPDGRVCTACAIAYWTGVLEMVALRRQVLAPVALDAAVKRQATAAAGAAPVSRKARPLLTFVGVPQRPMVQHPQRPSPLGLTVALVQAHVERAGGSIVLADLLGRLWGRDAWKHQRATVAFLREQTQFVCQSSGYLRTIRMASVVGVGTVRPPQGQGQYV